MTDASEVDLYTEPELYDAENTERNELPLLLSIAEPLGAPILDLACGTGHPTIPLVEAGFEVVGVDRSEPMIAFAREKARVRGLDVPFHVQDCRTLDLPVSAGMATMTGNAFQEFLTNADQDALLGSVYRHLAPGAAFVFGTRLPSSANLDKPAGEERWKTITDADGQLIEVSVIWSYDPVSQVQEYTFIERIGDGIVVNAEKRSHGRLRYTAPQEMHRLLTANGFDVEVMHGGWDRSTLSALSREIVVVARRR